MTETDNTNWLDEEAKQFTQHAEYEELPSLKLQPNVIAELTIDFSKPFQSWTGEQGDKTITKKIIPVILAGTKMNWWVNVKNPIYRELITAGKAGTKLFKVLQTGTQANTKYVLLK
jgi:hypothetical protein